MNYKILQYNFNLRLQLKANCISQAIVSYQQIKFKQGRS